MNVLVACEYSGIVRDAFTKRGHTAVSCDLLPTESEGMHVTGDVRDILDCDRYGAEYFLDCNWDLVIAHPPYTRLANAGVRWLHERNLWGELDLACDFFKLFLDIPCKRVAIENPIPHKYAVERIGQNYTQKIQPWQFGHGETKAICLWLKGLPPLVPTNIMSPGHASWMHSRFFEGVAEAMAEQWG